MNKERRSKILKSFTVGEIENPITFLSVREALENADGVFMPILNLWTMNVIQ